MFFDFSHFGDFKATVCGEAIYQHILVIKNLIIKQPRYKFLISDPFSVKFYWIHFVNNIIKELTDE